MIKSDKIIVLGGGSAGWMTASTLISQFPDKDITVIESPKTPTVGVGESTLGQINDWLNVLGIKDEDFMPHTDSSYKLSIRFENFYKKGDGGFHYPFGAIYNTGLSHGKQNWFFTKKDNEHSYADFVNNNMPLVNQNTLFKNENNELPGFNFQYDTAYHFDATKFGIWLRDNYCVPRGVKHIVEDIDDIKSDENGIVSLNNYKADLYIDCTGFSSLLMNKLNVKFNSYSELLPNNKAWATRVPYNDKDEQLEPYTNCTAIENGWVWNIPSWERIGTGYVYSDKYVTDEQALQEFKNHLDSKGLDYSNSEFKNIKMRVGIHEKVFEKNVCAIGLSAGFIEPLESNGLLSVHQFLIYLLKTMKRDNGNLCQYDIDAFNYSSIKFFNSFASFVSTHYALSHREDTEYWKDISKKCYSDIAKNLTNDNYFEKDFGVLMEDGNFFNDNFGSNFVTTGFNFDAYSEFEVAKVKSKLSENEFSTILNENKYRNDLVRKWNNLAKTKDSLHDFLKKHIHNKEI